MYTILIVDDERPAQTFLKAICQKYIYFTHRFPPCISFNRLSCSS